MELQQLLEEVRDELDDEVEPFLYSDLKLVRYLNEAVDEAAIRARLLLDSETPEVCEVVLQPGVSRYELHPKIIFIRRGRLDGQPDRDLLRTTTAALDDNCRGWRTEQGTPRYLVNDQQGGGRVLIVTPAPLEADVLRLTVVRYATDDEQLEPEDTDGEPAITDETHQRKLLHWVAFRALNKRDVEAQAKTDADRHLELFEQHFGPKPDAAAIQRMATDPVSGTSPHWF